MGVDTCPCHSIIIITYNHTLLSYHRVVGPWQPAVAQVSRAETHCRVVIACSLEDMVSSEEVRQMICYDQGDGYHPCFLTSKQCWPTMQPSWLYSPCSQAPSQHRFHSTDFLLVWVASCHCHHGVMSCYCQLLSCIVISVRSQKSYYTVRSRACECREKHQVS